MLSKKQISEIREHLEKAQNPVFLYDNDVDGLCSYVLLRRFCGKGKGVAVRTHPDIGLGYVKKAQQLQADYIFVLDRPILGKEFVEEVEKMQVPIVWIDHHFVEQSYDYKSLFIYNPMQSRKKSGEPVTFWSYKISERKEDVWIAIMGCIADHYLPDFVKEFAERYGDFWSRKKIDEPFDAYYGTEIGRLARALSFGLKDSITHVIYLQNFLIGVRAPGDVSAEIDSSSSFARKYGAIKGKYDLLLKRAKVEVTKKMLFFVYGGDLSISSDLSNELSYLFQGRLIVVAYRQGVMSNLSIRGKNARKILEKLIGGFEDASGGGHEEAVGARIKTEDLERFKTEILEEI